MDELYLTAAEATGKPGMQRTRKGVIGWMNSRNDHEWPVPPRVRKPQGRGRASKELHISCFPEATQAHFALAEREISDPSHVNNPDSDVSGRHAAAKQRDKDAAQKRIQAVSAVCALIDQGRARGRALELVAADIEVDERSVSRWYDAVRKHPRAEWLDRLTPVWGKGRPRHAVDEDIVTLIADDYLRPSSPSFQACYDRLVRATEQSGYTVPARKKLRAEVDRRYTRAEQAVLRKGKSYAKENLIPSQRRTVAHEHAMYRINGDGYEHNVMVRWPDGTVSRPHVWYWQDVYSRRVLGWYIDKTENTDQIRLSFQDVITQYGIPEHIHVDNTRPAASKEMSGGIPNRYRFKIVEDEALGLWPMLGCHVHFTKVYYGAGNGRAKPVEKMFSGKGGFGDRIDKLKAFEGAYTGPNVMNKPENYGSAAVELEVFSQALDTEIAAINAQPGRRTEMGQRKYSFDQVFAESYAKSVIPMPTKEQLRLFSQKAETVKVQKSGLITLKAGSARGVARNEYWSRDLRDHWAGEEVVARFDPAKLHDTIYIYQKEGQFICEAEIWEAKAFGSRDAAREYDRFTKQEMKYLGKAAKAKEHKSELLDVADPPAPKEPIEFKAAATKIVPTPHLGASEFDGNVRSEEEEAEIIVLRQREEEAAANHQQPIVDLQDPAECCRHFGPIEARKELGERLSREDQDFYDWFVDGPYWRQYQEFSEIYDFTRGGVHRDLG